MIPLNKEELIQSLNTIASDKWYLIDTSNVTDMSNLFEKSTIHDFDFLQHWDTSNVTNMNYMFKKCYGLTHLPSINTSNVTSMQYMFELCTNLTSLHSFDASNVVSTRGMFSKCRSLIFVPDLNFSEKLLYIESMFDCCSSLRAIRSVIPKEIIQPFTFNKCKELFCTTATTMMPKVSYYSSYPHYNRHNAETIDLTSWYDDNERIALNEMVMKSGKYHPQYYHQKMLPMNTLFKELLSIVKDIHLLNCKLDNLSVTPASIDISATENTISCMTTYIGIASEKYMCMIECRERLLETKDILRRRIETI